MKPIFNTLEFGGINSLEQGVFITGESVYNTPERDVESVEIAGRSGDYLLDKGRWKNIDVTYTCGCFGEDQDEFAKKIRNFRNLLASRYGYHRLVDSYNPEEYRLGVFKNPVDVDSQSMKRAGEFDVTFNCKPQRYLMSGETEQAITNGEKLYNPTPFDSNPLLAVKGYGTIEFNGYTIELRNETLGRVVPVSRNYSIKPIQGVNHYIWSYTFAGDVFNQGDPITFIGVRRIWTIGFSSDAASNGYFSFPITVSIANTKTEATTVVQNNDRERTGKTISFETTYDDIVANFGTTWTNTTTVTNIPLCDANKVQFATISAQAEDTITYTQDDNGNAVVTISTTAAVTSGTQYKRIGGYGVYDCDVYGDSSLSLIGDPTYIDCDLGDAYMIKNGTYIGLNRYIDLGSDLPTLASGNNEITFDNTVTELKIIPRFWIL